MSPEAQAVEDYLAGLNPAEKAALERIRTLVKRLVPDAVESISYAMPAFKYKKKPLVYYGAFKNHLSVFPTAGPAEALRDILADYATAKGTIQFTLDKPLPDIVLEQLILYRKEQIDG